MTGDTRADGGVRDRLLAAIRDRRQEFEAAGERAEELHPLEFCDVIEEMAYADVSVAWACMIGNGCATHSPPGSTWRSARCSTRWPAVSASSQRKAAMTDRAP